MKGLLPAIPALAILLISCFPAHAQWNMSRFDQYNYFTYMETVDGNHAFSSGLLTSSNGSFILRTNNGGFSWDSLTVTPTTSIVNLMFLDQDHGYAGGFNGNLQSLLRTDDNGTSWTDVTPNTVTSLGISGISFINPTNGYAADAAQVYRTLDGGLNWSPSTPGLEISDIGFSNMDVGYSCGSMSTLATVMKTTDGGNNWNTMLTTTLPFFTDATMQKLDVITSDIVYVSGQYSNKLFRTINGGISWDTINISVTNDITDFDFSTINEGHIVNYMGEIYTTVNGGQTWTLEYAVSAGAYGPSVMLTSLSFVGNDGFICGNNGLIKKHGIIPTGITEVAEGYSMYPNPVRSGELLYINAQSPISEIELIDITGRSVGKIYSITNFRIPEIPAGSYFVKFVDDTRITFNRISIAD